MVPNYNECIALCLQLHQVHKELVSIGWDVTVDKNNEVKILEWNGYSNDVRFTEATQGPCFKNMGWEHLWKSN